MNPLISQSRQDGARYSTADSEWNDNRLYSRWECWNCEKLLGWYKWGADSGAKQICPRCKKRNWYPAK